MAKKATLTKIDKIYSKKLLAFAKKDLDDAAISLESFVTSLQFLRDKLILTESLEVNGRDNPKISTLATAIKEYQEYMNCIHKYFIVTDTNITPRIKKDRGILLAEFNQEKQFHWENFWDIIKNNIEDWRLN